MTTSKRLMLTILFGVAPLIVGCRSAADKKEAEQEKATEAAVAEYQPLIKNLQSDDPLVELQAETDLKAMGAEALPALVEFAKRPPMEGQAQHVAVRLIGDIGGEPAAKALVDLLLNAGPHLKKDIVAQLIRLGKLSIDPLIDAIPAADASSLPDIQTVLLMCGDKVTVDKIVHKMHMYLRGKSEAKEGEKTEAADQEQRFRANMVGVMRAMTGHSEGFDPNSSEADQKKVMEQWVAWWGKNRDIVELQK